MVVVINKVRWSLISFPAINCVYLLNDEHGRVERVVTCRRARVAAVRVRSPRTVSGGGPPPGAPPPAPPTTDHPTSEP